MKKCYTLKGQKMGNPTYFRDIGNIPNLQQKQ